MRPLHLRVLHVITGLGAGGAERMLVRVASGAQAAGVDQHIVSLMDEGVHGAALRGAGVEVQSLGMTHGMPNLWSLARLAGVVRRTRPQVVMTWLYHADLLGLAAAVAAGLSPRRVVWNLRCSDMDLTHYGRSTKFVLRLLTTLSPVPGAVAANSTAGREVHARIGYRPRQWLDLPNGVDGTTWRPDAADRLRVRNALGVRDEHLLVGMVARTDPQKDHATFMAAAEQIAAAHPRVRFVLIGAGTGTLAVSHALRDRLALLDYRSDIPELLRGLDVHVLTSAYGEGLPNAVLEAMASGVPCVVTDVGDAAALVSGSGIAVPPRNCMAVGAAVLQLLGEDVATRAARGAAARCVALNRYGFDRCLSAYRCCWVATAAMA